MNRLVLIDGNAIIHRAYHALPPLTTQSGAPAGAVYGFISILIKLYNDFLPSHMVVAFDRPAPTFRKELYAQYQAKRPKMEDDLVPQVDKVHEVLAAFGIPVYEKDGFEADDVIGTIVKNVSEAPTVSKATKKALPFDTVIIVTGDRDILQLVDDENVMVFMPTKGLSQGMLYGQKEVIERMGVSPSQIPEFKALAGDQSDNYPGVEGVGPKTAIKLLARYGSLEKVLQEHAFTKDQTQSAQMSLELATIRTDAPIQFDETAARIDSLDNPQSRKALEDLHFPSLLKRLTTHSKQKIESKKQEDKSRQQQLC